VAFGMIYPFESPYIRALGASPLVIGLMGSLGYTILVLVRIPGSYIADRYGRKQVIVAMTFGIALSYVFYALAPDWRWVLIGLVLSNLCLIYQPALEAITADSIPPEKRGLGFAAARVIPMVPSVASPAVAGALVDSMGLVPGMRVVYAIAVLCSLAAAFVRLLFLQETLAEARPIRLGELRGVYREALSSIVDAWREAPGSVKALAAALVVSSFEDPIFMQFSSLYVFDVVGVSEAEWGILMSAWVGITLALGLPMGAVVDRVGRRRSALASYAVLVPSTALFIASRGACQLALAIALLAVGSSLIAPSLQALTADLIPREKRGRLMGTINTLNIASMAVASAVGGALYQLSPHLPFVLSMATGAIAAAILAVGVEEPRVRYA